MDGWMDGWMESGKRMPNGCQRGLAKTLSATRVAAAAATDSKLIEFLFRFTLSLFWWHGRARRAVVLLLCNDVT